MVKFAFILFLLSPLNLSEYSPVNGFINSETLTVTATVYNAVESQCDASPLITASGFRLDPNDQYQHRVVGISRDLKHYLNFGDSIYVTGTDIYDGWWYVEDVMAARWYRRIDFLINDDMPIGKWNNVKITFSR